MGSADFTPTTVAEITGNSYILLGVLVVLVFAIAYGLYTRQGSGINKHPTADSQDPVLGDQSKLLDEDSDSDDEERDGEDERAGVDLTEGSELDQRGAE